MKHVLRTVVFSTLLAAASAQEKTPAKPEKSEATAPEAVRDPGAATTLAPPRPITAQNDAPAQIAGIFFGLLQKGQIDPAYEGLTKGSRIAERPEELATLKQKTREATEVFGPVLAYELVETKNVGANLLRRTYLSLNKDFPLRWRFYFYRSENLWRLIDMRVDDRVTGMFDEPAEGKPAPETP